MEYKHWAFGNKYVLYERLNVNGILIYLLFFSLFTGHIKKNGGRPLKHWQRRAKSDRLVRGKWQIKKKLRKARRVMLNAAAFP